jgi:hypothetical protein
MRTTPENRMSKSEGTTKASKDTSPTATAFTVADSAIAATASSIKQSFLLLKNGTARKLGKQAEGGIGYRILGDTERKSIFLSITENDGGGYFSREIVPFHKVEACITKREQEKPFPSQSFKESFVGRSSNNAGFLAAILRTEGLLAAAPDTESQHVIAGDWAAWTKSLLSEHGTPIEVDAARPAEKQAEAESVLDHTERKKTLSLPRKKAP